MPPNPQNLKPFTKNDPRIWRGGRPKSFPALQELAQQIAHETAKAGGATVVLDGHSVTVAEMILRQWAQSKNPALQQKFMEVAFGKTPQAVVVTGPDDGPIPVSVVNYRAGIAQAEG